MKVIADIKVPETKYPVIDTIRNRWSARAFSNEPVSKETMFAILEAASWAPSAFNEQPWGYVVGMRQNEKGFKMLLDCLSPGNAAWAKNAGVLILSYAKLTVTPTGNPNASALHDTGMANQNLLLQATAMNVYGHIMGGFDKQKAIDDFGLTDDYAPVCMIALGYLDEPESLEEPFRSRELTPRTRKPISSFTAWI